MFRGEDIFSAAERTFRKDRANIEFFEFGAVSLTLPVLPEERTILDLKSRSSFNVSLKSGKNEF